MGSYQSVYRIHFTLVDADLIEKSVLLIDFLGISYATAFRWIAQNPIDESTLI